MWAPSEVELVRFARVATEFRAHKPAPHHAIPTARGLAPQGANNDYCLDVLPLMISRGYEPTALSAAGGSEPYLAEYLNISQEESKHNRLFFWGGGDAAKRFCDYELLRTSSHRRPGMREANAFFKLKHATITEPPEGLHRQFHVQFRNGGGRSHHSP
jgi:hypothetical protein